jgi:hypothetical protein
LHDLILRLQLGIACNDGDAEVCEGASATSSDALFENHNVWLKGMSGMMQNLADDAEQVGAPASYRTTALQRFTEPPPCNASLNHRLATLR